MRHHTYAVYAYRGTPGAVFPNTLKRDVTASYCWTLVRVRLSVIQPSPKLNPHPKTTGELLLGLFTATELRALHVFDRWPLPVTAWP